MTVTIQAVREREPWGRGSWYAEVVDVVTRAVLFTTDYAPPSVAVRLAETMARERGLEVRPC